jgi:hypothetical protein
MPRQRTWWRLVCGALAVATISVVSCFPQNQCDYQYAEYCAVDAGPDAPCMGQLLSPTQWQSGPFEGNWLDFSQNKNWYMHLRDGVTGQELLGDIINVEGYVSPEQNPNDPNASGNQFAPCAGNLCEIYGVPDGPDGGPTGGWALNVHNDSCAVYYVRVIVTTTGPGDAGVSAASDASTDAGSEASVDAASE